jgi:DHA1 family tetracycline resistance protein-like MFS transporter
MTALAKFALLAVVFVDLLGQGLVFPIINTLMMDPQQSFLPVSTPEATRHFNYGLVIGIFFLSWFLGAAYISRISDSIGRKNAIMICLFGALVGYAITIVSLFLDSLWLLILGRAITGFTAGNQPIAQAAMVDASQDDAEKARNMGFIVAGISAGLVGGPIIGGILSDKNIIGNAASITLPFYCAVALVVITIVLVQLFFHDLREHKEKLKIRPQEIFLSIWKIFEHPTVLRISLVFFFFQLANVTFYIFMDNYLTSRFQIGLFGTSMAMMVLGIALATSSSLFVAPTQKRCTKRTIVIAMTCVMIVCPILYVVAPQPWFCYVLIFVYYFGFGIVYPTVLGIFSASVSDNEQGWVMGITVALFTLAVGLTSILGGELMSIDIRSPFYVSFGAALVALMLLFTAWNRPEITRITL